jgi:cytochrome P450
LAYHPELQAKARQEVQRALASSGSDSGCGEFTHDILKQLPFVWQIFRETLRLFPTVPVSIHSCVCNFASFAELLLCIYVVFFSFL